MGGTHAADSVALVALAVEPGLVASQRHGPHVAMLVIGIAKLVVDQQLRAWIFGFRPYLLLSNLAFNVIVYWAIVAVAHGLHSYRSARERELRASQLEARLAETRLQLLSMQLQPHFLFNIFGPEGALEMTSPDQGGVLITISIPYRSVEAA